MPHRSPMPRPVRPLAALAIAALLFAAPARAQTMDVSDLRVLIRDVHDEKKAAEAVAKLRGYLASKPDSNFIPVLRVSIVTGLIVSHAPPKQIAAAADSAERLLTDDPQTRFRFYTQVSQTLVQNNAELPLAIRYLHQAIAVLPDDPRAASMRSLLTGTLGQAQLMSGQLDSAVVSLGNALDQHPDSLQVLLSLGDAWQKKGNADRAIDAYVRALACYPSADTTAAAPLRTLWKKKHGSLAGMDARVAERRGAARDRIAFDGKRYVRKAEPWTLKHLDGTPVSLGDFSGKIVVLDFWGSWCGPCREELPIFQRVYERYRERGVVFIGMNWEQPGDANERIEKARAYVAKNNYTFPVVLDHDQVAVANYSISGFPTVFVIDKAGMIRYRNVGVEPGIETILTDQIESLME